MGLVKAAESGLDFRRLLLAGGEGKEVNMNLINLNNKLVVPSAYFSLSSTEEGEFEFCKSRCYG